MTAPPGDNSKYLRIAIPGRWVARVLVNTGARARHLQPDHALPTVEEWGALLAKVTSAPSTLPGYTLLKYSKHGDVFRAAVSEDSAALKIICKQSRMRGAMRRLAYRFRPTRERTNFARAIRLLNAGIKTAQPLALVERRFPKREAWLVTRFVEDLIDLDQLALSELSRITSPQRRKLKIAATEVLVDFFITLERSHLTHRDLKASNLLIRNTHDLNSGAEVWLVDLDGLRVARRLAGTRRWKPLTRLAASLLEYASVTRTDYGRFLRNYLGRFPVRYYDVLGGCHAHAFRGHARRRRSMATKSVDHATPEYSMSFLETSLGRFATDSDSWKSLYAELASQAADYRRKAAKRKTHKLDGYSGD